MKTSIAASAFALMTSPAFAQDVKTTLPDGNRIHVVETTSYSHQWTVLN